MACSRPRALQFFVGGRDERGRSTCQLLALHRPGSCRCLRRCPLNDPDAGCRMPLPALANLYCAAVGVLCGNSFQASENLRTQTFLSRLCSRGFKLFQPQDRTGMDWPPPHPHPHSWRLETACEARARRIFSKSYTLSLVKLEAESSLHRPLWHTKTRQARTCDHDAGLSHFSAPSELLAEDSVEALKNTRP